MSDESNNSGCGGCLVPILLVIVIWMLSGISDRINQPVPAPSAPTNSAVHRDS